jgi:hypothetical protein
VLARRSASARRRENGNPADAFQKKFWIPASAGMTRREIRNGRVYNRQCAQPAMENFFTDWTKIVNFFEEV